MTASRNNKRRLKQRITAPLHDCLAVTPPGFEACCQTEISALSDTVQVLRKIKGGVLFRGKLTDIVRANVNLRVANRIVMRIDRFKATNFMQLEKRIAAIDWDLLLPSGALPQIKTTSHRSRLYHTGAVTDSVQKAIAAFWSIQQADSRQSRSQTLFIRLKEDEVTLSLDSSGAPLYRRGLKTHAASAPLRETLAAAILKTAGFRPDRPLLDPMCGAGTFCLEAAMMAKQIPPGFYRNFAFMQWPAFPVPTWRHLIRKATQDIKISSQPMILASDLNPQVCDQLQNCILQNRLDDAVSVRRFDFFQINPSLMASQPGLVVLNPPYGRRLDPMVDTGLFYRRIAEKLRQDFTGWCLAIVMPDRTLAGLFPGSFQLKGFEHGGLKLWLLSGKIP